MVRHTDMEMMVIKEEIPRNRRHGHAVHGGHMGEGGTRRQKEEGKQSKGL